MLRSWNLEHRNFCGPSCVSRQTKRSCPTGKKSEICWLYTFQKSVRTSGIFRMEDVLNTLSNGLGGLKPRDVMPRWNRLVVTWIIRFRGLSSGMSHSMLKQWYLPTAGERSAEHLRIIILSKRMNNIPKYSDSFKKHVIKNETCSTCFCSFSLYNLQVILTKTPWSSWMSLLDFITGGSKVRFSGSHWR